MRYGIVRHKQAVGVFILLCIFLGGCRRRCEFVGFYRSGLSKGNIVERRVRQIAVCRSGNFRAGEVKIISAAGGEGKDVYKRQCVSR